MIDCAAVPSQNVTFNSGSRDNAIRRRQKRPAIKIDYPERNRNRNGTNRPGEPS